MLAVPVPAPSTVPLVPTLATPLLLLLHVPVPSVNDVVVPAQMLVAVDGSMAAGSALTVTVAVVWHVPMLYVIVAVPALAPVTVPFTTVALVLPLVHVPPVVASVRLTVLPTQMLAVNGEIATGAVFTVIVFVVIQPELFVNVMFAVPAVLPVTMPVRLPIDATDGEPLLQVPVPSVSVVVVPAQRVTGVDGVIAAGKALTVTFAVVLHVPMLYVIVAVPALAPVTVPPVTPADVELLVHVPPLVASVSTVVDPWQMTAVKGVIATGALFTVTGFVTKQPDELVNVMLAVPTPEPVTVPLTLPTLAILLLLLLHVPETSESVVLEPRQIVTGVTGVIADGEALTVTGAVVIHVPIA